MGGLCQGCLAVGGVGHRTELLSGLSPWVVHCLLPLSFVTFAVYDVSWIWEHSDKCLSPLDFGFPPLSLVRKCSVLACDSVAVSSGRICESVPSQCVVCFVVLRAFGCCVSILHWRRGWSHSKHLFFTVQRSTPEQMWGCGEFSPCSARIWVYPASIPNRYFSWLWVLFVLLLQMTASQMRGVLEHFHEDAYGWANFRGWRELNGWLQSKGKSCGLCICNELLEWNLKPC